MRLVFISDTHNQQAQVAVPDGDVLVHCGDSCGVGTRSEVGAFLQWLKLQPHAHKIVIAGNHDRWFEGNDGRGRAVCGPASIHYLEDDGVDIDGVRFWGSPWQPEFCDWAFNLKRGPALAEKWALIPNDIDVLVTHGPPRGIMDRLDDGDAVGCDDLLAAVQHIKPRVHAFGHIHEGYGARAIGETLFVNASTCSADYKPANAPIVVDLYPGTPPQLIEHTSSSTA